MFENYELVTVCSKFPVHHVFLVLVNDFFLYKFFMMEWLSQSFVPISLEKYVEFTVLAFGRKSLQLVAYW